MTHNQAAITLLLVAVFITAWMCFWIGLTGREEGWARVVLSMTVAGFITALAALFIGLVMVLNMVVEAL